MRALLVTSEINFVPENYDRFVVSLAGTPQILGLLVIKNKSWDLVLKGLFLILSGGAPRVGWQLIKNYFGGSAERRAQAFQENQKQTYYCESINSAETLALVKSLNVDLIINARTREIYKKNILQLPVVGCINIHHGLLPNQRGLMCDFWAHQEDEAAGFSIHQMTVKIDDGALLKAIEVPKSSTSYLEYLERASVIEAQEISKLLNEIERDQNLPLLPNPKTAQTKYRKNPQFADFAKMKKRGIKI